MNKYTPGKFIAKGSAVYTEHGMLVASVLSRGHLGHDEMREESHANTRLLASSPELLGHVKVLLNLASNPEADLLPVLIQLRKFVEESGL